MTTKFGALAASAAAANKDSRSNIFIDHLIIWIQFKNALLNEDSIPDQTSRLTYPLALLY